MSSLLYGNCSSTLDFGMVLFYLGLDNRTAEFHCDHELVRGCNAVMENGDFLTYGTAHKMVAMLEETNRGDDPRHRSGAEFHHRAYPSAVLADFVMVFGTSLQSGQTVTGCVFISASSLSS